MAKLYKYYQLIGGKEAWQPIQAEQTLEGVRPTFVTILAVDTLLAEKPTREDLDAAKYSGPLYFDLDAEDIQDAIADAKVTVQRLQSYGLQAYDFEVYLSGKKGLHIIIPEVAFNQKPVPMYRLFDVYKEIAFKLSTPSTDLRVYTGRKGRMLRTCYNVRENGNYKVQISLQELESLTPETYKSLCAAPRHMPPARPEFRFQFGLLFDEAVQKAGVTKKRRKPKVVTPGQIQQDLPVVVKLLNGESEAGFNLIAMQLALYARESGWNEEQFINRAQGLIANHKGGSRYGSAKARERELCNMLMYVEDNFAYEYNSGAFAKLLTPVAAPEGPTAEAGDETLEDGEHAGYDCGIYRGPDGYYTRNDEGIENYFMRGIVKEVTTLVDPNTGAIMALTGKMAGQDLTFSPEDFQSSSAMQRAVSRTGISFTASDIVARKLYEMLIDESKRAGANTLLVEKEGLSWFKSARSDEEELRKGFLIYADERGVRPSVHVQGDYPLKFNGYPDPTGKFHSDLSRCPSFEDYLAVEGNREKAQDALWNLFRAQPAEVLGKLLGWQVACFYRSVFHVCYGKFPLLHVVGQAGAGKTEVNLALLRLHYHHADPVQISPTSTVFAIQSFMMSSASIPLFVDEYKPNDMPFEKHHAMKLMLRDAYNCRPVMRGGGKRGSEGFASVNEQTLTAPTMFVAEAIEAETALLERVVLATFRRLPGIKGAQQFAHFQRFQQNQVVLSHIGAFILQNMLARLDRESFSSKFDALYAAARAKHCLQPGDLDTLSAEEIKRKGHGRERIVYNYAVAEFGLGVFGWVLKTQFGDMFDKEMAELRNACYSRMSDLVSNTVPEYVRVLQHLGDMSHLQPDSQAKLNYGYEFQLKDMGGRRVLELAVRPAYNKYRIYCKNLGMKPLFNGEDSLALALKDCGQFMDISAGTKHLPAATTRLDYESLVEAGMTIFAEK
jgi:hypothetical protein